MLGLAEGEFPAAPGEVGLLTHADRDALMAQEIDLPDCFENRVAVSYTHLYRNAHPFHHHQHLSVIAAQCHLS